MTRTKEFDWISNLPENARAAVLASMSPVSIPAGRMIFERDTSPNGVFQVMRGKVRVFHLTGSGRTGTIRFYKPIETIGDLAAIDARPRQLFAEAVTDCEFQFLPIEKMQALRATYPEIDATLVLYLAHSLRQALQFIEALTIYPTPARVAMRLDWLAREEALGEERDIDIAISQADFAQMVGVSRQAINGVLRDLQKCGALEIGYSSLRVLDLQKLNEFMQRSLKDAAKD